MFRRPASRRRSISIPISTPRLESLEARTLLSAASAAIDLGAIEVVAGDVEPGGIIVKWKTAAGVGNNAVGASLANLVLPRASSRALTPLLSRLQRITLPDHVNIQAALEAFRRNPLVEYAELDHRIRIAAAPDDPRFAEMWDQENGGQTGGVVDADIDATAAWDVHTGSHGTVVAVIDTGIDWSHPDLDDNLWINVGEINANGIDDDGNGYVDDYFGYDFINGDGNPMDDQGHGTHVAGTIGAEGNNGIGVTGVNWNVQLMALKFLGADGSGSTSDAIEAILYAIDNGAHIINASWGGDPFSQALFDAIASARAAGTIFVAAAGNGDLFGNGINNDAAPFYPSGYALDNIVSVAATDHLDRLGRFSNYGATTVDLAAPGVNILSTTVGGGYGLNTGTSMAAPHVAGVLALVRDLHPTWSYTQVIDAVLGSVDELPSLAGLVATGGRLNAASALGNPAPPPPPPPPVSLPFFEDFNDSLTPGFEPQSGPWSVSGGRYVVEPSVSDDAAANIATIRLAESPPDGFELHALISADQGYVEVFGMVFRDFLTNAFFVFDYVSPTAFKFAGADMDLDRWVIGHRDAAGWHTEAFIGQVLAAATNYAATLRVTGDGTVRLLVGGVEKVAHSFTSPVTTGQVGLGSRNSTARFDNVVLQEVWSTTPGELPLVETFDDGLADHLAPQQGIGGVTEGRYLVSAPDNGDGVSLLSLVGPLPMNVDFSARLTPGDSSATQLSNGFLIFDYQSPTDFKFAGAYVGSDQWLIGRRSATGWATDAFASGAIDSLTDYDLRLTLEENNRATLYVDGVSRVSLVYGLPLTDGAIGLGTRDATAHFDDLRAEELVPPAPEPLPWGEDFNDGESEAITTETGSAAIVGGRYELTGADGIALFNLASPLPSGLAMSANVNANGMSSTESSNAFLIFDYHSPTDFKFAGAYLGAGQWVIGRRTASGWITTAYVERALDPFTDYELSVVLDPAGRATLRSGGVAQVSYDFGAPLNGGALGLATRDATTRFDDLAVVEHVPSPVTGSFPFQENFDDGLAEGFTLQTGGATVTDGRLEIIAPPGSDGLATVRLAGGVPPDLEVLATINANNASGSFYSNAFLLFDYHGPTDFKFAGALVGADQWVIGRRTASGWVNDAVALGPISGLANYELRLVLDANGRATLFADGVERVGFDYGTSLTGGEIGIGTNNAIARFDDLQIRDYVPPPVLVAEDFNDGFANGFQVVRGTGVVENSRYRLVAATGGGDGISLLPTPGTLPTDLDLSVTFNAEAAAGGRFSNGFILFDYQSPTDFRFAGAYVGSSQWLIGRRTASGWLTDAVANGSITVGADYHLRLVVESSGRATLFADGVKRVSVSYGSSLSDGAIGLGTRNAITRFDDVALHDLTPQPASQTLSITSSGTLVPDSGANYPVRTRDELPLPGRELRRQPQSEFSLPLDDRKAKSPGVESQEGINDLFDDDLLVALLT